MTSSVPRPAKAAHMQRKPGMAFMLGACSGVITESICYPLEWTKNIMQLDPALSKKGMVNAMRWTFQTHGMVGFYRGFDCLLAMAGPRVGIRLGANEFLRKYVFVNDTMVNQFLAGVGTGIFEAIFPTTPFEAMKIKLINDRLSGKQPPLYNNVVDCGRKVIAEKGVKGLYYGVYPTIGKIGSSMGIRFLFYEQTMGWWNRGKLEDVFWKDTLASMAAGGFGGALSVIMNNPIDVVKTQMQGLGAERYKGSLDCFKTILREEGPMGFYKGVMPRMMRVFCEMSLSFAIFDALKKSAY
jgi:solute carrier family 25 citrate transporter 1